jgi:hypothetical protein
MWTDSGYDGKPLATWMRQAAGLTLQIIKRSDQPGFQVVSRRWVVERTFGWLMRYRRLARDYERTTAHHEAMIYWSTVLIMTRRLARYKTGTPPIQRWGGDRHKPTPGPRRAGRLTTFIYGSQGRRRRPGCRGSSGRRSGRRPKNMPNMTPRSRMAIRPPM